VRDENTSGSDIDPGTTSELARFRLPRLECESQRQLSGNTVSSTEGVPSAQSRVGRDKPIIAPSKTGRRSAAVAGLILVPLV
jgi:rhodanese-related sulfurtransferase